MEVRAPRGFRDFLPAEASRREHISYTIGQLFERAGYGLIETPVLEALDVIQTGLHSSADDSFRFCDIDGRIVALRSDLTVPVARMVATRFTELAVPYRLRYAADVFTEAEQLRGQARHRTQLGIELIGADGIDADAEIIRLVIDALREVGLVSFKVHVNDEPARLGELLSALDGEPYASHVVADESILRARAYYTGMVFDVFAPRVGIALGGGGRYDDVLAAFGRDLPAAGFGLDLQRIVEALQVADAEGGRGDKLRIAVPKATLFEGSLAALERAGLDVSVLRNPGRQLYFETDEAVFVLAKSNDVPVYVATGAVDCGIVGSDILLEEDHEVLKLADLGFGAVTFVVASPADDTRTLARRALDQGVVRVATKFPRITQRFFDEHGIQIEMVKINGSVEIAPLIGIADVIIDITETGTTLRQNNLEVIDEVADSSAWFVANPASARLNPALLDLAQRIVGSV